MLNAKDYIVEVCWVKRLGCLNGPLVLKEFGQIEVFGKEVLHFRFVEVIELIEIKRGRLRLIILNEILILPVENFHEFLNFWR